MILLHIGFREVKSPVVDNLSESANSVPRVGLPCPTTLWRLLSFRFEYTPRLLSDSKKGVKL